MSDAAVSANEAAGPTAARYALTRTILTAAALFLPSAAVTIAGFVWLSTLPGQLAFHWTAAGRPDGFFPTEPLFWMSLIATVTLGGAGLAALLIPSRDLTDTRKSVTVVGTVAAFAAAAWIVPAAATYTAASAAQASPGGWLLLFVVALAYGAVPRLLMPPKREVVWRTASRRRSGPRSA